MSADEQLPSLDEAEIITEGDGKQLLLPRHTLPDRLMILPIFGRPFFPAQIHPMAIDKETWGKTIERAMKSPQHLVGLLFGGPDHPEEGSELDNLAHIGCIVKIHNLRIEDDKIHFVAQGLQRFTHQKWIRKTRPLSAKVTYPEPPSEDETEIKAYAMALIGAIKELIPLNPLYSEELKNFLNHFNLNDPSPLADFAAAITTVPGDELQRILDCVPLVKRMELVLHLLRKELEVARIQSQIREEVNEKMTEQQRQFFLREQLKVIQRELGITKDDRSADVERFRERMQTRTLPENVNTRFEEELNKLSILETGSAEYGVTRNYLDWMTHVPWGILSEDQLDLTRARKVLDNSHAGLGDIKDRILEFIAEGAFRGSVGGSIILLVGPPGVGKTSIGRAVADCLGRKFFRFSVGGVRDEAEIKGHRRTYVGAMPGKLVQALKEVEVENPVIVLDEVDKIGNSYQGDPASALLEVLDPEQNREFLDHYLDLRVDLSKVLFVCTANQLDTIPRPLLDRMDVIRLGGYITQEKVEIARKHLWPRLLKRAGVKSSQLSISNSAIRQITDGYAREAGVRGLEKLLHKILRKSVVQLLDGATTPIRISNRNLEALLGAPLFRPELRHQGVGVITGLAWTSMGGATLAIEAGAIHKQSAGLRLTGQLGDVMKESAQIALSYVRSNAKKLNIPTDWFDQRFIHLHVPEGATPKDGPSAGVTMASALISLAQNKPLSRPLAMTGELTLRGNVLAVGGIREKIIAARRQRITEVILPAANQRDFDELPEHLQQGITAHFVQHFQQVAELL